MKSHRSIQDRLYHSSIAVDARWFFGTIVFLLGILNVPLRTNIGYAPLVFLFIAYLGLNAVLYLRLSGIHQHKSQASHLHGIDFFQAAGDVLYIFFMGFMVGAPFFATASVLLFVPIIFALVALRGVGTLVITILASVAVFFLKVRVLSMGDVIGWNGGFSPLTEVIVVVLLYILVGFFGTSIMRTIRDRGNSVAGKIEKEEEHIRRLSVLAKEFDVSAKLLVRRDLDLMKAHRELERIDQMKSEIISVVAHQLRTPLSAVKWTLKMLTDGDAGVVPPEQKTMMMKAYESNERMIALINDMLSADRLESGKFRYRFFPIQLEDLIESVITELLAKAGEHAVSVRFLRQSENLPRVTIDPDKIREVLQNLIDNAIKYSRRGGTVNIGLQREEKFLLCSIADQGIGIPKTEQEKIFGRFFRAQNALRVETDGSGLGLFIVRGIIQRHGGDVTFDSEEGKGTTMHIRLPLDPLPHSQH